MAMALPVVLTEWGSVAKELAGRVLSVGLHSRGVPSEDFQRHFNDESWELGRWAEPSVKQLRRHLRWLLHNPEEARALGSRGREAMLEMHSPTAVAPLLLRRLRAAVDRQR